MCLDYVYRHRLWDICDVQTKSEHECEATHFYVAFNSSPHHKENQFLVGLLKCIKNYIDAVHCTPQLQ